MSPQQPDRASTPPDEIPSDMVLEPEVTATTSYRALLEFEKPQRARLHKQSIHHIEPQRESSQSSTSLIKPAGLDDAQRDQTYRQHILHTETKEKQLQSSFSECSSSDDSQCVQMHQEKNDLAHSPEDSTGGTSLFSKVSSSNFQQSHTQQEGNPEKPQRNQKSPVTTPGMDEDFRRKKYHLNDLQKPILPSMTSYTTPPGFTDPQRPFVAPRRQTYVPNFSRPFSRSNPPVTEGATWRARLYQREIQEECLKRRGKLAERIVVTKNEVIQKLHKEIEMIDERSEEIYQVVGILAELES